MKNQWTAFFVAVVISLVIVLLPGYPSLAAEQDRMKVILDVDTGDDIDDAWALAFVIAHKNFEPLGMTMAHGNTPARAKIAAKMLHLTGRSDIPVLVGRQTDKGVAYQFTWAENFTARQSQPKPAAEFIVETVKRYPGQVTLIAVGPLENLADALRQEPQLGKYVKRVVLMSGCIYGKADQPATPIAEYNVRVAIADAQLVYSAGLPLTIVPLDSTTLVKLNDNEREQVRKYRSPLTYALESLYRLWIRSPQSRMTLHDQLAVAEAASPDTFFRKKETLPLVVDDKGFTRIDRERGKPVVICFEPKRDEFMQYYIAGLTGQRLGM